MDPQLVHCFPSSRVLLHHVLSPEARLKKGRNIRDSILIQVKVPYSVNDKLVDSAVKSVTPLFNVDVRRHRLVSMNDIFDSR